MTVIRWIKEGKIPAFTTAGGHRRIARAELMRFCKLRGIPFPIAGEADVGRVLVVDSDATVRDTIADAARAVEPRLRIDVVGDAFSAGQALATLHPQLVFLDQRLPGIDAGDLVARLSQPQDGRTVAVVVVVAAPSLDLERSFRNRGALACMPRPPVALVVDRLVRAAFGLEATPEASPTTIHIVHADGRAARALGSELEQRLPGCRVSVFASQLDALVALTAERPDVVLCDDGQLEASARELVRRLLNGGSAAPVPIIAVGDEHRAIEQVVEAVEQVRRGTEEVAKDGEQPGSAPLAAPVNLVTRRPR